MYIYLSIISVYHICLSYLSIISVCLSVCLPACLSVYPANIYNIHPKNKRNIVIWAKRNSTDQACGFWRRPGWAGRTASWRKQLGPQPSFYLWRLKWNLEKLGNMIVLSLLAKNAVSPTINLQILSAFYRLQWDGWWLEVCHINRINTHSWPFLTVKSQLMVISSIIYIYVCVCVYVIKLYSLKIPQKSLQHLMSGMEKSPDLAGPVLQFCQEEFSSLCHDGILAWLAHPPLVATPNKIEK